ncbi:hypothetical protein, partial [Armatimonas sp.]|uniref:hypothetical protein n=1 Tax=Armatimonas sp. TaxID=1872638 RepID=UPI0037520476
QPKLESVPLSREQSKARAKTQAAVDKAEQRIALLETRLGELETSLGAGNGDLIALAAEHTQTQNQLAQALTEWERLGEELG